MATLLRVMRLTCMKFKKLRLEYSKCKLGLN